MNTAAETVAQYVTRVAELAPLIEEHVAWSQQQRRLAPQVVDAFHEAGLFRLMIPLELGGEGMQEYELVPIIAAVAAIDASAGWNLAIGNGSLGFLRGLDATAAAEILATPRALIAGSIGAGIVFRKAEGGFQVAGRGAFASGCSQATWMTIGGPLMGDEGPVRAPNGGPALRMGIVPVQQVEILDTWNVTGLRGTGSHDIVVHDVFVPAARVVEMGTIGPLPLDPLGAIPVNSRLGSHLAAVAIGAASHALMELKRLAGSKPNVGTRQLIRDRADVQIAVGRATGLLEAARATVTSVITAIVPFALQGEPVTLEDLARIRISYVIASRFCLEAVDLVHAAAGTTTLDQDSVIGRCWRDVHAVAQHILLQDRHYETVGKVMLGLPPQGVL